MVGEQRLNWGSCNRGLWLLERSLGLIKGRLRADNFMGAIWLFLQIGGLFRDVLKTIALRLGVHIRATDFWKLPHSPLCRASVFQNPQTYACISDQHPHMRTGSLAQAREPWSNLIVAL